MIIMPVVSCETCPFYADGPLLRDGPRCRVAAFSADPAAQAVRDGTGSLRRVDEDVKKWCPLKGGDITVTRA